MALETKMIFKTNRGGALLQIGSEAWNLPALSFLSCGSAQPSSVFICGQSSPDAPLLALLPPQQSNLKSSSSLELRSFMPIAALVLDEGTLTEGQTWADFRFQQNGNRSNVSRDGRLGG